MMADKGSTGSGAASGTSTATGAGPGTGTATGSAGGPGTVTPPGPLTATIDILSLIGELQGKRNVAASTSGGYIGQDYILTTADKVKLAIRDYQEDLKSQERWAIPAGILLSIILTMLTADFKDALGVKGASWTSFFMLLGVAALIFTIYFGIKAIGVVRSRNGKSPDVVIIERLSRTDHVERQ